MPISVAAGQNNNSTTTGQTLRSLFLEMVAKFPGDANQEKLNLALNLMSVILTPPSGQVPTNIQAALTEYRLTTVPLTEYNNTSENTSGNTSSTLLEQFTQAQKNAIDNIIRYAQENTVNEEEATRLIEEYSEGMQGGFKKKSRKRKNTRRSRKNMKKRKTRGRK